MCNHKDLNCLHAQTIALYTQKILVNTLSAIFILLKDKSEKDLKDIGINNPEFLNYIVTLIVLVKPHLNLLKNTYSKEFNIVWEFIESNLKNLHKDICKNNSLCHDCLANNLYGECFAECSLENNIADA